MKMKIIFLVIVVANVVVLPHVEAETTSNSKLSLTDGSGIVTPPLNPIDPTNPIITAPTDPLDPDNNGTGAEGPLSIDYVSNFYFGEHKISGSDMTFLGKNLNPYIQVTDTRGTGAGWKVQASISEFLSSDKKAVLKGAEFTLKNPILKSASESNLSTKPNGTSKITLNSNKQSVVVSVEDAGKGTWLVIFPAERGKEVNENLLLHVPAGSPEANTTYTATIKWELLDGPK
ncbi:MAG: WxL domain-containing protein [Carnobacterium sp.]|uniref:WxL domain-containing protein n=1 Tax=Carnobacterium sp. TaxID=48221 RepID=UPI002FC634D1